MSGAREKQNNYVTAFARFESELTANEWEWSGSVRREAIGRFAKLGLPTTKLEDWKFTSIAPIAKINFEPAPSEPVGLSREVLVESPLANIAFATDCHRLVFVNGQYSAELSSIGDLPSGTRITSLGEAMRTGPAAIEEHLARYASYDDKAFVALNTAFMRDGAFVEIASGEMLDKPVHIVFAAARTSSPIVAYPRNLIVTGDGSQLRIIESYVDLSNGIYLTNAVTEIVSGENAVIEHYKLQDESETGFHVGTVHVNQDRNSNFTGHSVTLCGELVRNNVTAILNGEGVECSLNGLYITDGRQHVDNHTVIDHAKPHGASRELYKGILDGKSSAVFNGSIVVRKDAQKTDARQSNKNLLISEEATINSKPQLEINADDVKCTHGTSIGHLDGDSLFYLQSRGIDLDEARAILTFGFANDVLSRMKVEEVRAGLEQALLARLSRAR